MYQKLERAPGTFISILEGLFDRGLRPTCIHAGKKEEGSFFSILMDIGNKSINVDCYNNGMTRILMRAPEKDDTYECEIYEPSRPSNFFDSYIEGALNSIEEFLLL
jgi:hypothetical protein